MPEPASPFFENRAVNCPGSVISRYPGNTAIGAAQGPNSLRAGSCRKLLKRRMFFSPAHRCLSAGAPSTLAGMAQPPDRRLRHLTHPFRSVRPRTLVQIGTQRAPRKAKKEIPMRFRNILFPVDFSARSHAAVPHVRAMAEHFGASVTLLHVVQGPPRLHHRQGPARRPLRRLDRSASGRRHAPQPYLHPHRDVFPRPGRGKPRSPERHRPLRRRVEGQRLHCALRTGHRYSSRHVLRPAPGSISQRQRPQGHRETPDGGRHVLRCLPRSW